MNRTLKMSLKALLCIIMLAILSLLVWHNSRRVGPGREGLGTSFDFDLAQYQEVDSSLITYEEAEPLPVNLPAVAALAVGADDRLYVGGDKKIVIMDGEGKETSRINLAGAVTCLAVDAKGSVFAGIDNHVEVFNNDGSLAAKWDPEADDARPVSIAVGDEAVFVGEARKGQVLRYDMEGVLVDSFRDFILFSSPILGIDLDADQNLWAANPGGRQLRRYAPNGTMDMEWANSGRGIDGFSGCCNPVDIAVRADGNIVTTEKSIVRVKVVSPKGEVVGVVAGPSSFDQSIKHLDVAIDTQGRVLVLDPTRKSIRVFVEK